MVTPDSGAFPTDIDALREGYPLMSRAIEELTEIYPLFATGFLEAVGADFSCRLIEQGEEVLKAFANMSAGAPEALRSAVRGYGQVCFDFTKYQGRFQRTGRYHRSDASAIIADVYRDAEVMKGYYLDGLLLTFAFWPNHQAIYRFYTDRFLTKVAGSRHLVEIGPGHGLFTLQAANLLRTAKITIVDVSPFSLSYTRELVTSNGHDAERLRLLEMDVAEGDLEAVGLTDALICGEVLEHVENPVSLARRLVEMLEPGGRIFLTTCANTEAVDHVYLFESVDHIRQTLVAGGMAILDEIVLAVPGMESDRPMPLNYACVVGAAD